MQITQTLLRVSTPKPCFILRRWLGLKLTRLGFWLMGAHVESAQ